MAGRFLSDSCISLEFWSSDGAGVSFCFMLGLGSIMIECTVSSAVSLAQSKAGGLFEELEALFDATDINSIVK